jgi:hypothetical protein
LSSINADFDREFFSKHSEFINGPYFVVQQLLTMLYLKPKLNTLIWAGCVLIRVVEMVGRKIEPNLKNSRLTNDFNLNHSCVQGANTIESH